MSTGLVNITVLGGMLDGKIFTMPLGTKALKLSHTRRPEHAVVHVCVKGEDGKLYALHPLTGYDKLTEITARHNRGQRTMRMIFLDTETTGLDEKLDQPWEVSLIIRDLETAVDTEVSWFVNHNYYRAKYMPKSFREDYDARFKPEEAITRPALAANLREAFYGGAYQSSYPSGRRPTLIGAVPGFDTVRLSELFLADQDGGGVPWHYHVQDVETAALGYLQGRLRHDQTLSAVDRAMLTNIVGELVEHGRALKSDVLSLALGVNPENYNRHQGIGDCRWVRDQWDAIFATPVLLG